MEHIWDQSVKTKKKASFSFCNVHFKVKSSYFLICLFHGSVSFKIQILLFNLSSKIIVAVL